MVLVESNEVDNIHMIKAAGCRPYRTAGAYSGDYCLLLQLLGMNWVITTMNLITRSQPTVHIASYNPYDARYPNLKVVSRESLHLIKRLKASGINVVVDPDDERPLLYSTEKGFREFIADPVYAFLTGIPVGLMVNLASSWITERLQHRQNANISAPKSSQDKTEMIVEISEDGRRLRYDHTGLPISDDRFYAMLEAMERRTKEYREATFTRPPTPRYPIRSSSITPLRSWAGRT